MTPDVRRETLVVTGMSGAGRSTVANALEDVGWYVVDNLPPAMLSTLIDLAQRSGESVPRVAAIVDIRGGRLFADVEQELAALSDADVPVQILFLDASDDVLVRRYEQVRRPHPLQGDGTILDGIAAERRQTAELRARADLIIDTTDLNVHQLSTRVHDQFAADGEPAMRLTVLSFGYKYGLPSDADLVADCRFLPNPYWDPKLRGGTGLDEDVRDFVLSRPGAMEFVDGYSAALLPVLEGYGRENKRRATIAVGCTGGKHRSVAVAEELARRLRGMPGVDVSVRHRDLGRE